MKKISVAEMMKAISRLKETRGIKCTLLGIGPVSKTVVEAAFLLAKERHFPLMFIASRNQVDARELGGGYVCNWDQQAFVNAVSEFADKTGFDGICHVCRDHGGPWQRDNEKRARLSEKEAMDLAKKSYLADLLAGFDLLHIDPTKDPHIKGVVPMELIIGRTVELIEYIENERMRRKLPPVAYEVGTEETNGGLTSVENYGTFIKELTQRLHSKKLPLPVFIVGQTGTLTRLNKNIGNFNTDIAMRLSTEANKYGVGLKEHNSDYLPDFILYIHPILGIAAANVAPEFGMIETGAYLLLAGIEKEAFEKGILKKRMSDFAVTIKEAAVKCDRWRKWMVDDIGCMAVEQAMKDETLSKLITEVAGHYTFEEHAVKEQKRIMFDNLEAIGIKPGKIVTSYIMKSIERYVKAFNLDELTPKIMDVLDD